MVTGFDILGHDKGLRNHWQARLAAFAVDAAVIFIPVPIIIYLLDMADIFTLGLLLSLTFYLSTSILETLAGSSIGKKLLGFQVHAADGGAMSGRAFISNLDRLLWFILPPLNFAVGMSMRGDPRRTALDRLAGTVVVHRGETELYESHVEAYRTAGEKNTPGAPDVCQECGGRLLLLPDKKLQCEKCGLIQ
jgi:uncharacterized RDD family membrane protein YckC